MGDLEDEDDDSQPLVMDLKDKSDKESTSESLSNKEECPQSAITAGGESSVTSGGGLVTQATPKKSEMPFASVPLSLSSSSPPEEKLNTANNRYGHQISFVCFKMTHMGHLGSKGFKSVKWVVATSFGHLL